MPSSNAQVQGQRSSEAGGASPIRFSVVTAVYNVGRYLDDYIRSIEVQDLPPGTLEVIVVDDGSTDDSLQRLRDWQQRRPDLVCVLTKANGGQASARNLGLDAARGEWVTFTDPDDMLEPGYFQAAVTFLAEHPEAAMMGVKRIMLDESKGTRTDTHPLKSQFRGGTRLVSLTTSPDHFYGSAPCSFFRLEQIQKLHLRFSPEVRPNFEDGHFSSRYLLSLDNPAVGFLAEARYIYRKRADSTSTLQNSLSSSDRYTRVLEHGYLDVLRIAELKYGAVPGWLQQFILYELSWYFSTQDSVAGAVTGAVGQVSDEFHGLMKQITGYLDPVMIDSFTLRRMRPQWRRIMAHAYRDEPWRQEYASLSFLDTQQKLVRLTYLYTGSLPTEDMRANGVVVMPIHAKSKAISYHGRILIRERILWLPSTATLRLYLDGQPVELIFGARPQPTFELDKKRIRSALGPRLAVAASKGPSVQDRLVVWLANSKFVKKRFKNAWVLMDRIHDADDNAERLFRYLRKRRRKINAWFVLEKDTPDWKRLKADGYRRLIPHGSVVWKVLMLNAKHLISSHADVPIISPPDIMRFGKPRWRFTFLQHGVIKDDLSNWLDPKQIDTFITSSEPEYRSIAGEDSPYKYTNREVKLTGLPRFDRLRSVGRAVDARGGRDLLLVTPTWRHWLLPPLQKGSQRRELNADFFDSEFIQQWLGLLRSPELERLCKVHNLKLAFLPHPNLQGALPSLDLPAHVEAFSYAGNDVQELFARAAVLVTDYSSIAFNAAYIERPVVYFQFDAERVENGGHVGRKGYFSYARDGFGPVVPDLETCLAAIIEAVESGPGPLPEYQRRIEETFPLRDGRCCKRVVDAIAASARPWSPPKPVEGSAETVSSDQLEATDATA